MSEITAELPADGRPMEGRSVADSTPIRPRSHSRLGRLKLKTVADLDGRTRAARRARAVVAELVKALGGPDAVSPGQRQACERAGMLTAIAEDLAARQLAGLPVTLDEVLRAEGVEFERRSPNKFCARQGLRSGSLRLSLRSRSPTPLRSRMASGSYSSGSRMRSGAITSRPSRKSERTCCNQRRGNDQTHGRGFRRASGRNFRDVCGDGGK